MRKILLVDDSATFARLMQRLLSERYEVVGHAKDGALGFTMFQQTNPDLILLDITMPNVNGKDCLAAIMKANPNAKVIMVSSIGDSGTVRECLALGAKAFVNKESVRVGTLAQNAALDEAVKAVLNENLAEAI